MPDRFKGRTVVVTGAGGGLGSALARGFAGEGATLVLTDLAGPGLDAIADELKAAGTACSAHALDLSAEAEIHRFGAEACARYPKIDVLVNNAGIAYGEVGRVFETLSQEKWLFYLSVNSIAPLLVAQALRPSLAASGQGVILNQSSMASYMPAGAYGVTKATLNAITYGMAHRFSGDGIRVNAIAPGIMETPASKADLEVETYQRVQAMQLLKMHGTASDIVSLALFLASDEARFINNEIVHCDAGNQMRGWRG